MSADIVIRDGVEYVTYYEYSILELERNELRVENEKLRSLLADALCPDPEPA